MNSYLIIAYTDDSSICPASSWFSTRHQSTFTTKPPRLADDIENLTPPGSVLSLEENSRCACSCLHFDSFTVFVIVVLLWFIGSVIWYSHISRLHLTIQARVILASQSVRHGWRHRAFVLNCRPSHRRTPVHWNPCCGILADPGADLVKD